MFCVTETTLPMDSRKRIICGNCGREHVMFSCLIQRCMKCNQKFANIYLMSSNKAYKANYYFYGMENARNFYDTDVL